MILRELANVLLTQLYTVFERSWRLAEIPGDWGKVSVKKGQKYNPGKYSQVRFTFALEKKS